MKEDQGALVKMQMWLRQSLTESQRRPEYIIQDACFVKVEVRRETEYIFQTQDTYFVPGGV